MTCIVNEKCRLPTNTVYVIYDIEAIGDVRKPSLCRLWNIAAQNYRTGAIFHAFVDPNVRVIERPPHPDLFPLTRDFLESKEAKPWSHVGPLFLEWMGHQRVNGGPLVLVSHGNFMLDKPLLEVEYGRLNTVIPAWIYFYDTLFWFRMVLRKRSSYSLKNLYQETFGQPIANQHLAMPDVLALRQLLDTTILPQCLFYLRGSYYPAYYTPLQRIKYVGNYNELLLIQGGCQCVEDLHLLFLHQCRLNQTLMKTILDQRYHLQPDSAEKITHSLLQMLLLPPDA